MSRERITIAFNALAVGQSAKIDGLARTTVDELLAMAEEMLGRDEPLRRSINKFCTDFDVVRQITKDEARRAALAELAVSLIDAASEHTMDQPPLPGLTGGGDG